MKKKLIILSIGICSGLAAYAQQQDTTLIRTVVVENEYNPTVMDASKINVLPKVEEPTVPKTHIDYATSIRPVAVWNYQAMQPIVKDWKADAAYRGYLRAGYGNNGNVDARLGYLWDITKNDRLNVAASFGGWNGDVPVYGQDWDSRFYRTRIGLDYKHSFRKMDFLLGGKYTSQVFNYPRESDESEELNDKQHHTLLHGYVGVASTDPDMPVQFAAEAGIRSFREKYPEFYYDNQNDETSLYLAGDVWKQAANENRYGLKVKVENYAYDAEWAKDWTALEFNPYLSARKGDWKMHVGAHLDWSGGENDKLYVSPDIKVEYLFADSYVLFAKAEGGRQLSSLYESAEVAPYFLEQFIAPTYMTLDAALGLKASPANGWWFLVSGGYQIRENDACWVWHSASTLFSNNYQGDTKVFYGTAELKYDYKDLLDFSLKGTYYNWKWESDGLGFSPSTALSLKPELELEARVGAKVMEGLRAHVGYEYVKRCNDEAGDPVGNLYVGADYRLLKNLSAFVHVNNLLNKEYIRPDAFPAQKLNFLAGISFQF